MVTGYPFSIITEKETAKAVLASTHLGPCLGHVAAETIFGENIPAGRTPSTWYKSIRDLPDIEDYDIAKSNTTYLYFKGEPLYPFGYGLSYTKFKYSSAALDKTKYGKGESVNVSVEVKNTGDYDADEVVQLYVVPAKSYYKRPLKTLKGFKRIAVKRGETVKVEMTIPYDDLAFWSTERGVYIVDAGDYTFEIGASSSDIKASLPAYIDGEPVTARDAQARVEAIDAEDYAGIKFLTDKSDGQTYIEGKGMGYAVYPAFDLSGINSIEVIMSSPAGQMDLTVIDHKTGEFLGYYSGEGTGSFTTFVPITFAITPRNEITDIRLLLTKQMSIKSFRFFSEKE
jgi:beta-glucosidase